MSFIIVFIYNQTMHCSLTLARSVEWTESLVRFARIINYYFLVEMLRWLTLPVPVRVQMRTWPSYLFPTEIYNLPEEACEVICTCVWNSVIFYLSDKCTLLYILHKSELPFVVHFRENFMLKRATMRSRLRNLLNWLWQIYR